MKIRIERKLSPYIIKLFSLALKPYSRLILAGDNAGWVLDWEMREIKKIVLGLGKKTLDPKWQDSIIPQSIFYASQFFLLDENWIKTRHRIGFSYFHGLPNQGNEHFDRIYHEISCRHDRVSRIHVSHKEMRDVIIQTGIDPKKLFLIPIGINPDYFPFQTVENKYLIREKHNIPKSAFVIGSFQKDGIGWQEGLEPKLIKGPDVFLSVIKELKAKIPELHILLSGPARGYMKAGLENLNVPYFHFYLDSYPQVGELFQALDLYLVTSRQEGGPKAILESMSSGVPIISTRVGQATDLINQGQNGWLTDVEDVKGLASLAFDVYQSGKNRLSKILVEGRKTAEVNSYQSQIPMWNEFFRGFVE